MPDVPKEVINNYIWDVRTYANIHKYCKKCLATNSKECIANTNYRKVEYELKGNILYLIYSDCRNYKEKVTTERTKAALEFSKIPKMYEGKTWADYQITNDNNYAVAVAKGIVSGKCKGGYIFGTVGTGKTFLASLIAKDIIAQNKQVVFGSVPELMADLKNSFDKGTTKEILKRYIEADFLVLDDLGSENITPWVSEQLFLIINARVNDNKRILVTSNYNPNQLASRLVARDKFGRPVDDVNGQRIVSRLSSMCTPAQLSGKDWRM